MPDAFSSISGASSISVSTTTFVVPTISTSSSSTPGRFVRLRTRAFLNKPPTSLQQSTKQTPPVVYESLRILEWDKVCDNVASFAGTSLGKQATKEQLWSLNQSYEQSIGLLEETNAAVEMHKYGAIMDFSGIDFELVSS